MSPLLVVWVVLGPVAGYLLGYAFGYLDRKSKEEEK